MNRAMILPAAIAAGLHIAVLGFKASPRPVASSTEQPAVDDDLWTLPIIPEDPPPVDPDPFAEPPELPAPAPLIPQGAELPSIESFAEFQIIRPPAPKVEISGIDHIDPNWQPHVDGRGGPEVPWVLVTQLDNIPRALLRHSPARPPGTGDDRETVTVDFVVGKDGTVTQARIADSTSSALEEVCLRAVKRWRFEPGMRKSLPVAFRMQQAFVFTPHE